MSRFAFVAAERANHAVAMLCRVLGASVSGFYTWLGAIPVTRARTKAEAELRGHVGRIFAARRRAYGSRRVHATRPESTLGMGQKTLRPTAPARRTSANQAALTDGTP